MYKASTKDKLLSCKAKNYFTRNIIILFFIHNRYFSDFAAYPNKKSLAIINKINISCLIISKLLYDKATLIIEQRISKGRLSKDINLGGRCLNNFTNFTDAHPGKIRSISVIFPVDHSLCAHLVNLCLLLSSPRPLSWFA
jgi:hypothetical protein